MKPCKNCVICFVPVVSNFDSVLTPSKSVRVSSFLSSLQDTPRPKSRNSPPQSPFIEEEDAIPSGYRSARRNESKRSIENSSHISSTVTYQPPPKKPEGSLPTDLIMEESSVNKSLDQPAAELRTSRSEGITSDQHGVQKRATHSDFDDPNFIFEWRQKYLKGSVVDSSTPKKNFTEVEFSRGDPDVSSISAEKVPDALNINSDASETVLSDIDDSAVRQAREVLRQLDSSRRNLEKTQKIISEMELKQKPREKQNNDSNNNHVKNTSHSRRSRSRNSTHNSSVVIEGDDILEEAKRVLREINNSSEITNKSTRSNASRNLADSFEKIFEKESERKRSQSQLPNSKSPKKSYAPGSLSNLATNELDFLEDCNDTLLKISEVSRAKNYAFARETNMANEFLRRVSISLHGMLVCSLD